MPNRNEAPTLKMLATRKVAWPDGVNRREIDVYPCVEQFCRETLYSPYLNENLPDLQECMSSQLLQETSSKVIKSWIQLSNYYQSTLDDFKHLELFMVMQPPEVLDFLEEDISLSNEQDRLKILRFALRVPRNGKIQSVTSAAWKSIVATLTKTSAVKSIKEIEIQFDENEPDEQQTGYVFKCFGQGWTIFRTSPYHFATTLQGFQNLTKLVIRGIAHDTLLHTVGTELNNMKHLDISNSSASLAGVRSIFFKGKKAQAKYVKEFYQWMDYNLPKQLLTPLCETLEYFEMSSMTKIRDSDCSHVYKSIKMACPQLVATPCRFFFKPVGKSKIICRGFYYSPTFKPLRQILIMHVRSALAEDIFCFTRGFLACTYAADPSFELRVDEKGTEVGFLFFAKQRLIGYCELENLTVINFTSYSSSACHFIEIDLLGHLAPNLERLKAPLKGVVSEKYPLNHLKQVSIPIAHKLGTLTSLLQRCPELEYLEVQELLLHPGYLEDKDLEEMFKEPANNLEVFRIRFRNKISLLGGFTTIISKCPSLRLVGDLKLWNVSDKTFFRLHKQLELHNFQVQVEYDGVLYKSDCAYGDVSL